jgi:small-conductance mechanosensitive channel
MPLLAGSPVLAVGIGFGLQVSSEVVNHSRPTSNLRIRINVAVAYGPSTAKTPFPQREVRQRS